MQYKGFLIDLDGTMYKGNGEIIGAKSFIHLLNEKEIPYLFITNNATLTREGVVRKLARFQIETSVDHVLTSAIATANYLKTKKPTANCYVIGEEGLQEAFREARIHVSDEACDVVVVGLDRSITYEKLAKANLFIRNGATFISTNNDAAIPTERGFLPGNGAITSAITVSSGAKPLFVGKPNAIIMDEAMKMIGLDRDQVLMVGDNYHTDILAGIHANIDTLMVLTGFSSKEDIVDKKLQPKYIMKNLQEWTEMMMKV